MFQPRIGVVRWYSRFPTPSVPSLAPRLHASFLRTVRRRRKPLAIQERRVRPPLRQEPPRGRHRGAQQALRNHDENRLRAGAVVHERLPDQQHGRRAADSRLLKNVHYFLTPWEYLDIDTALRARRQ